MNGIDWETIEMIEDYATEFTSSDIDKAEVFRYLVCFEWWKAKEKK